MSPRRRTEVPDPVRKAAQQEIDLVDLRDRLTRAGIGSQRLAVLLTIANTKGGLGPSVTLIKRAADRRKRALALLRERECSTHLELHRLLDDPDATECNPARP